MKKKLHEKKSRKFFIAIYGETRRPTSLVSLQQIQLIRWVGKIKNVLGTTVLPPRAYLHARLRPEILPFEFICVLLPYMCLYRTGTLTAHTLDKQVSP